MMPQSAVASVPASEDLLFLRNLHASLLPWNSHHPLRPIFFCWAYVYQHGGDEVDSIRRNAHRFQRHRISTIKDREPLGTKPTGPRQSSWGRSFAVSFSSSRPMIMLFCEISRKVKVRVAFFRDQLQGDGNSTKKFARPTSNSPFLHCCEVGDHDGTALGDAAAQWFVAIGVQHVCCEVLWGIICGCLESWSFRGTK